MPDYYSLLVQKIREAETDSGKLRELVYEAARLALKRHVNVHYPALSLQDGKRLLGDLEAAIERLEADAAGTANRPAASSEEKARQIFAPSRNAAMAEAPSAEFDFLAARAGKSVASDRPASGITASPGRAPAPSDQASSIRSQEAHQAESTSQADAQFTFAARRGGNNARGIASRVDELYAHRRADPRPAVKPRAPADGAELLDWPLAEPHNGLDSRDLVLLPEEESAPASRVPSHLAHPSSFSTNPDKSHWEKAKPRHASSRTVLIGFGIASHIAVAVFGGAAFYLAMSGRAAPPPVAQDAAAIPAHRPAKPPPVIRSGASPGPTAEPVTTASFAPATNASAMVASMAALQDVPRPTAYGVYAISRSRLIELEQVSATPVDPRARNNLQIVKPSRTVINDAKLSFVVYRRDLALSALDKVPVRIAARIARAMTVDPLGKAVMEPPPVDTWLIRETGPDLRIVPVSENAEMMLLRPESEDFAFPPGRYELLLGGLSYDFVVAGIVRNPAHCVEGVTTARGPVFYECRAPR